jgi:hypothetical protein
MSGWDAVGQGDWYPNLDKFPNGLAGVADRVNALGLSFGIWMEPEMISVDSDLYRAQPEWPLHVGKRPRTESRNQLVLGGWAALTARRTMGQAHSCVPLSRPCASAFPLRWGGWGLTQTCRDRTCATIL